MRGRAIGVIATIAGVLVGCGGSEPDTHDRIERAVRAVYGAVDVLSDERSSRKEVIAARDAFCRSLVVFTGDRPPRAGEIDRLPAPSRARCREGFEDGEPAKTMGYTRLSSIGRISVTGNRAVVRMREMTLDQPSRSVPSGALAVRRAERWRIVLPCVVIGCYAELLPARQAERPRPKVLDELRGRYRGTAIGDLRSAALRRQGTPPKTKLDEGSGPVGSDFYEDGTPSNWSPPGASAIAGRDVSYRGRSYLVEDGRGDRPVYGFIITDRRAETSRGVGIGDTLAFARRRYPQLRCDVINQGTEYVAFPSCVARIAPRRHLGFGQNPIRSIALMTVAFDGGQ